MNATIIENIPFDIQAEDLYPLLKIKSGNRYAERLDILLESARDIARPKVAYRLAAVEHDDDGTVLVDAVRLKSRVMQVNLKDCRRAFPFVTTCGMELEKWSRTLTDTLEIFWADTINMMALVTALEAFKHHMNDTFETGMTSTMNPGSLEDWPLSEQHKIFSILGAACGTIGVQLNESGMMVPLKSVSGIEFESGEKFHSCQLCPRDKCPSRRAPYDEHLYAVKYQPDLKRSGNIHK
jgi:hypothetical protein